MRGRAYEDPEGRPSRLAGIVMDITDHKRSEEQLRHTQKLESLGVLAGGVAHDFNNLLTVVIGRGDMLLNRLSADDKLRRDVDLMNSAAKRAAALTRQLLQFSRQSLIQPRSLNVNTIISGMKESLQQMTGDGIELATRLAPSLDFVKADTEQLQQAFTHLAANARDAMPGGGRLSIVTENVVVQDRDAIHRGIEPGAYVLITVSDNGQGLDETTRLRIFEPFFTTKELGRGKGLGLATVYGIVRQSHGQIQVSSEPGHGTTFKMYFPRVERTSEPSASSLQAAVTGGNETVLVVDDEEHVR